MHRRCNACTCARTYTHICTFSEVYAQLVHEFILWLLQENEKCKHFYNSLFEHNNYVINHVISLRKEKSATDMIIFELTERICEMYPPCPSWRIRTLSSSSRTRTLDPTEICVTCKWHICQDRKVMWQQNNCIFLVILINLWNRNKNNGSLIWSVFHTQEQYLNKS